MTLGRQYDFALDYLCPLSNGCISSIVFGFHLGDYDRLGGERLDHAVKYTSPDLGGLQFGALYSLGGQPGSLSKNSATSVGASYRSGPVQVGASYTAIRNFTAAFDLGTPVFGTSLAGLAVDKYSTGGVGASYRVGKVLLHGVGTFVDFQKNGQSVILRTGEAGVTYELTEALRLNAGYAYTTQGNLHWHQGILAANYFLSKRTDVYCHLSTLQASSGTRAALFPLTASDTSSQSLVSVGIRHKF
jgi:predicted porin